MLPLLIAGAAMMAGGAIGNAITQAKAKKKRELYLAKKEKEIKDDYNNALGDATQSAAAQKATTDADKAYQQGVNVANNAVTGGALDRAKMLESVNNARAEAASQITAQGEALRQQAQQRKESRLDSLDATRQGYEQQDAQNAAQGWSTLSQVGGQFIGAGMSSALSGSGSNASAASKVQSQVAAGGQPITPELQSKMNTFNAQTVKPFTNKMNQQIAFNGNNANWVRNMYGEWYDKNNLFSKPIKLLYLSDGTGR